MKERAVIEKEWAKEKYNVMMHSQKHYDLIREKLKRDISLSELKELISEGLSNTPEAGAVINTFDHMWGYFKKVCTTGEKEKYLELKKEYKEGGVSREKMLRSIKSLADKYEVEYLQNSTVLKN
jgi:uncharacterized protein YbgA (DUF1722 family)